MSANCYLEHSAFEGVKGFEKSIEGKALRAGLSSASIDCSRYVSSIGSQIQITRGIDYSYEKMESCSLSG
jgi:hypothetical protein